MGSAPFGVEELDGDVVLSGGPTGTVTVTVTNIDTGESESIVLTEDGGSPGTFNGIVATQFGTDAEADLTNGRLNTENGNTVRVSYDDAFTAAGGTATLLLGVSLALGLDVGGFRGWVWLIMLSGVLLAVHFASWITSLEHVSVLVSVVLVTTNPIWVALLTAWTPAGQR